MTTRDLSCRVVIPVGPGHEDLARDAIGSVLDAWQHGRGPFTDMRVVPIMDTEGVLGRSAARLVTARFILQGSRPRRLLLPALLPLRKAAAATASVPAPACCPSSPASSKRGLPCMLPEKEDAGLLE